MVAASQDTLFKHFNYMSYQTFAEEPICSQSDERPDIFESELEHSFPTDIGNDRISGMMSGVELAAWGTNLYYIVGLLKIGKGKWYGILDGCRACMTKYCICKQFSTLSDPITNGQSIIKPQLLQSADQPTTVTPSSKQLLHRYSCCCRVNIKNLDNNNCRKVALTVLPVCAYFIRMDFILLHIFSMKAL